MHNCKLTRKNFIDLALDEMPGPVSTQLLAELNDCEACQTEYVALRSTLHVSSQALRSALPAEEFWSGYHSRLQSKLLTSQAPPIEDAVVPLSSQLWLALRRMLATSVRVPVPVALGLMLLLGVAFFMRLARANAVSPTPVARVETKTVEVPVIQEKVVTRVVYLEKRGDKFRTNRPDRREVPITLGGSDPAAQTALSLIGFKPTEEVKLTVIKGSSKDEKR